MDYFIGKLLLSQNLIHMSGDVKTQYVYPSFGIYNKENTTSKQSEQRKIFLVEHISNQTQRTSKFYE